MKKGNFVIITGPAGCGLSSAEYVFEELGYIVVKNVPGEAVNAIIDKYNHQKKAMNICLAIHAVGIKNVIEAFKNRSDVSWKLIVLNCEQNELLKRYALTRRVHPRSVIQKISPTDAIKQDVDDVLSIVNEANLFIDTTSLTVKQLRAKLYKFLANVEDDKMTSINFISFGIKNGIPQGIDCFFDVRLIPNPYWVEDLRELTGEDQKVIDYMQSFTITQEVIDNIVNYLTKYLYETQKSGRGSYTIGIACSGGQHRSTYVANYLANYFAKDYRTSVVHRDSPSLNKE